MTALSDKLKATHTGEGAIRVMTDHIKARVAELRTQNDGDYGAEETAKLRGRIAELSRLYRELTTSQGP